MNIPGLSVCPVEESGSGMELATFAGKTIFIPESHRYGHCRSLNEFQMLENFHIEGQFGVVYKCRDIKSNKIFALKLFKMPKNLQNGIPSSVLREIKILKILKGHPNIICSYGTVAGRELDRNYLVLDYCEFSLKDLLEGNIEAIFDKAMVKFFMYHIFLGLKYIHDGLIIHRDICPKNIMFTNEGVLKIGGFRASRFYDRGNMSPGVTELNYRAPELLIQSTAYGPAVDMWSAGCIFAELVMKRTLFCGNSELDIFKSIMNVIGIPNESIWPGFEKLISEMKIEGAGFNVTGDQPHSDLKLFLSFETAACQELILDLILYNPHYRHSADVCLLTPYFTEKPQGAKSEDLLKTLQNLKQAPAGSETMEL